MNRDREPTQVIDSTSPSALASEEASGLSKIKATALLLKQKVAGTNIKPQKVPNKISHPWSLSSSSSRSNSFPAPNTNSTNNNYGSPSSTTSQSGTIKKDAIKAMIAAREDPSLSCNKMAPQGIQPAPAPQKRDVRAGMTKVQLSSSQRSTSSPTSTPIPPQSEDSKKKEQLDQGDQLRNDVGINHKPQFKEQQKVQGVILDDISVDKAPIENNNIELSKRPTRRRNVGGEALLPSQFSTPPSSSATPLFMKAFQNPNLITTNTNTTTNTNLTTETEPTTAAIKSEIDTNINEHNRNDNNNNNNNEDTQINNVRKNSNVDKIDISASTHSSEKGSTRPILTPPSSPPTCSPDSLQVKNETKLMNPNKDSEAVASKKEKESPATTITNPKTSKTKTTTPLFEQRPPSSPRRHTTSSSSSSSSSLFSPQRHNTPPLPHLTQQQIQQHEKQLKSHVNPTLRQIQTPHIPVNLVQARILQQEEQKKKDEELAKIPITANLRTVKKVQAVLLDDEEEEANEGSNNQQSATDESGHPSLMPPSIPSGFNSLGPASVARPRSKTTTSSTVTVSTLLGGKQRGDRNHVEPVVIPKKLADQVEHILGRKLAGKGSVLDEREQEREEEEARKAAEPLPPIVRGQPRKRAMTSAHIRNLVSSWDHKVEEAKEITTEAEQVRQFLEQRSAAHAELPKFSKVQLSGSELLKPLPSLPPPPPVTNTGKAPKRVGGHSKAASTASPYMTTNHFGSSSISSPTLSLETSSSSVSSSNSSANKDIIVSAPLDTTAVPTTPSLVPEIIIDDQETSQTLTNVSSKPSISLEHLETKRSGSVLDNKAVLSRPRRARKVTLTQAEA
ncbi:hypothetical protein BGZ76_004377 [Entomortierella beljakovae]|nr:hypothetical protein BGZ76_004377 [Entomortierella beljakovae]